MKDPSILLEVHNLTIAVNQAGAWVDLVKGISFKLMQGQSLGIVGESGCGKSLTVQAIMRLLPQPDIKIRSGHILYQGIDIMKLSSRELNKIRGNKIAMVFQEPMTALNPVRTVYSQIAEQIKLHYPKLSNKTVQKQTLDLLNDVGIELANKRQHNYPHQLSGGMRQRVMIAMALSCRPELIIADEPTTALDVTLQAQILELLHSLQEKYNTSLLFISHDLGVIAQVCGHALVMYDGRIIESASIEQLFHQPQHPYSQALMLCSPSKEHPCRQPLPSIQQAHIKDESEEQQKQRFKQVLKHYQYDKNNFEKNTHVVGVNSETLIDVHCINKRFELNSSLLSFSKHNFHAVKNISFNLKKGQTLGIVGASGSGKTTLAKIISGLLPADSGEIEFEGKKRFQRAVKSKIERLELAKNIQYIFQDPQESLNSRHNIQTLLTEPLKIHNIGNTKSQVSAAEKMLLLVGLPQTILSRYPHEFSGGQKQRIGIARALMLAPKLLVCDEPVSALDVSVQAQILNLLVELQQKLKLSIIFITHDLSVVRHMADQIAVMHKGEIIEYGPALQICDQPQQNYTQQLIAAIPSWPIKNNRLA
ncbi:MAG: peptide/nickel transport system ATP-binding protein [Oceanospirillaceae bacterium]|jgi:peptide/nickel transport system ATP-binding protein